MFPPRRNLQVYFLSQLPLLQNKESSLQNSTSTMPDRQQQQQAQQLEQQQQQEHMKLWKRYGDPAPLSPITPNQPICFGLSSGRASMTPMTPSSGLNLDPNDPFINAFMKRIPDAKFDERTGTLSGVTMWVS